MAKQTFVGYWRVISLVPLLALVLVACSSQSTDTSNSTPTPAGPVTLNLGYFPNVTHAVALVGVAKGTFQSELGSNVILKTQLFNAGPALITALFANAIDIGYVGPNPAIDGYVKSHGAALRIIAGAASGGASLIVRPGAHINTPADLANKKMATPQLGGTQDVALRYYLQQHGLQTADKGGNVQIIPADNATILTEFKLGQIDGAWVPEPWATRLIVEGKGKLFVDERSLWPDGQFVTTNVVVRKAFYDQHPDIVKNFLKAHVDTVEYILSNPQDAKTIVNSQLQQLTGKALPTTELNQTFQNLDITYDPLASTLQTSADRAFSLGFLGQSKPDLSGIYSLDDLNAVLTSKNLPTVAGL